MLPRNNAAQGRSNRYAIQFRQDRIGGGAISVACDDDRDLFGRQGHVWPICRLSYAIFAADPTRLPLNDSRMNVSSPLDDAAQRLWPYRQIAPPETCAASGTPWWDAHRSAARLAPGWTPSIIASVCAAHLSFMRTSPTASSSAR